jgi:hypothetical protein
MSDEARVHTDPGDASPSFPNAHAIPNRVRSRHMLAEQLQRRNLALRCLTIPALRNLWFIRNSAAEQN